MHLHSNDRCVICCLPCGEALLPLIQIRRSALKAERRFSLKFAGRPGVSGRSCCANLDSRVPPPCGEGRRRNCSDWAVDSGYGEIPVPGKSAPRHRCDLHRKNASYDICRKIHSPRDSKLLFRLRPHEISAALQKLDHVRAGSAPKIAQAAGSISPACSRQQRIKASLVLQKLRLRHRTSPWFLAMWPRCKTH
jgi:hypothetical protein